MATAATAAIEAHVRMVRAKLDLAVDNRPALYLARVPVRGQRAAGSTMQSTIRFSLSRWNP
jgi:hypothetical protein